MQNLTPRPRPDPKTQPGKTRCVSMAGSDLCSIGWLKMPKRATNKFEGFDEKNAINFKGDNDARKDDTSS